MTAIPVKTIERLSKYRRVINRLLEKGETYIFSHDLAHLIDSTPAQVRRDLMQIGHTGSPKKGYELKQLKGNRPGRHRLPGKSHHELLRWQKPQTNHKSRLRHRPR